MQINSRLKFKKREKKQRNPKHTLI